MSTCRPRSRATVQAATSELERLPGELVRACRWVDVVTRDKQHHTRGRGPDGYVAVAQELLRVCTDPQPELRSPYVLHSRAIGLHNLIRVNTCGESAAVSEWREVWQRFTAALALSVDDVLHGRPCDLSGRLIVRRTS